MADAVTQALLQRALQGGITDSPTLVSPQVSAFRPGAAESNLMAQAPSNPYALAHAVGERGRRAGDTANYLEALQGNNLMRLAAAKRSSSGQQAADFITELVKNPNAAGAYGEGLINLGQLIGLDPAQMQVLQATLTQARERSNAGAFKDVGAGMQSAAAAGVGLDAPEMRAALGFSTQQQVPTGVQEAQARNVPKVQYNTPSGLTVSEPITQQQADAYRAERLGNVTEGGQAVAATPAQAQKIAEIEQKARELNYVVEKLGVDQSGNTTVRVSKDGREPTTYVIDRNGNRVTPQQ